MCLRTIIMIWLTIVVTVLLVSSALATPTLHKDAFTGAEVLFHDVPVDSKYHNLWVYDKVDPIRLDDGSYTYIVTDGFYLHIMLGDQVQLIESIVPEKASEELFEVAQRFNYFYRMQRWSEE